MIEISQFLHRTACASKRSKSYPQNLTFPDRKIRLGLAQQPRPLLACELGEQSDLLDLLVAFHANSKNQLNGDTPNLLSMTDDLYASSNRQDEIETSAQQSPAVDDPRVRIPGRATLTGDERA
jgi:hypothetical protein